MSDTTQSERARRLGEELRLIRKAQGLTIKVAAAKVRRSTASLSRIENGQVHIRERDVLSLLAFYEITDEAKRLQLMELARPITNRLAKHSRLFELELTATRIKNFEFGIVPGLLQVRGYIEAVCGSGITSRSRQEIRRLVDLRMARQELLAGPLPPDFHFIIGEAALHLTTGGHQVMYEQIHHLLHMSDLDHVSLRLLPFTLPSHPGTTRGFILLDVPGMGTVPLFDTLTGSTVVTDRTETARYALAYDHLQELALTEETTRARLEQFADLLEHSLGS
ncbi:helix-turn-helix transcriptional regulator [Actinocorallia sp. B10E7]|uniref:helix-turn-helix domain-containing protein n=1 Tax=Actinocorallia sp. B10E7 TaxID=3153558 RepID=UPI00325F3F4F